MINLTNISRDRHAGKRTYTAEFKVESRNFKLLIEEWYLYTGVEYTVKIKELNSSFFKKLNKPKEFPNLKDEEWYHLYFEQSNAQK
jgi:hypothetical protein